MLTAVVASRECLDTVIDVSVNVVVFHSEQNKEPTCDQMLKTELVH